MFKQIETVLRCPKTGKKLTYNPGENCYDVDTENFSYPIYQGIIRFIQTDTVTPDQHKVIHAYNEISNRYDTLMTSSTLISKFIIHLTWGGAHEAYTETVTNRIPDNFSGILVDIPVGTGIYTAEKYSGLTNATLLVVDFSIEMLKIAQARYKDKNIHNVVFIHGDAGCLPFADKSVDIVLSMNGFHSFPEKETALSEMARVLKDKGQFSGCSYVSGKRNLSDIIVNISLKNTNLFAEPFHTMDTYIEMFSRYFDFSDATSCRSFFLYEAYKKVKKGKSTQAGVVIEIQDRV